MLLVAAVVTVGGFAAGMAAVSGHPRRNAPPTHLTVPRATISTPATPTPTVTQEAPPLSEEELARYRPVEVKAVPAVRQVALTWRLPAESQADGAGVIVRRAPAEDASGLSALSRTEGRLPQSYVAVPLESGRRYCFLVGVLLKKATGGTTLAQSTPVCATPR